MLMMFVDSIPILSLINVPYETQFIPIASPVQKVSTVDGVSDSSLPMQDPVCLNVGYTRK